MLERRRSEIYAIFASTSNFKKNILSWTHPEELLLAKASPQERQH
jgi:hypothetical protein